MQNDTKHDVQELLTRFEQALSDARQALDELLREREISAQLRKERDELQQQLQALRQQADSLTRGNREALARVDSAMDHIRKVLDEQ